MFNLKTVFAFALFASLSANATETEILFDTQALHDSISAEMSLNMANIHQDLTNDKHGDTILLARKEEAKDEKAAPKAE
ncbi:hypothetical protein [Shewanella sp.]|uniref:hypothetical protein n=1 Tax=Shewanella sp. TaxID=50422 RepID=UPI0035649858